MGAPANVTAFKNKYLPDAKAAASGTPIFPETILAAAGLESGYAKSQLSSVHNNFFGIKADARWKGAKVNMLTKEQDANGNPYTITAAFRKYDTATDCFKDYVKFIQGPRYIAAGVTKASSPQEQMQALQKAGYATDKKYSQKLIAVLNWFGDIAKTVTNNPGTSATAMVIIIASFAFAKYLNR